jgi:hypothetical protein
MLNAGIHPKIVSERLGHASVSITLDTYSDVLPGLQEETAVKFDEILSLEHGNGGPNVIKALAKREEVESRPYRSRTCDTLIKRYSSIVPPSAAECTQYRFVRDLHHVSCLVVSSSIVSC